MIPLEDVRSRSAVRSPAGPCPNLGVEMVRGSRGQGVFSASIVAMVAASALPAMGNPVAGVRVTNASGAFDLAYVSSASSLGGYVTSDNPPQATVARGTTDAYTITSASAQALAGVLIYRVDGDPSRECTFRYTLTFAGGRYTLAGDARATWTGPVKCTVTTTSPDKAKGDFSVTFTMQ